MKDEAKPPKVVTVIGAGALGSHLVPLLRNTGAKIRVCDFDRVENKNTQSQFHGRTHVGTLKVLGLKQTVSLLWNMKIEALSSRLTDVNTKEILGGSDLLVDCVDNAKTRRLIQSFAKANSVPCVHGGLDQEGTFGRVCWTEGFVVDEEPAEGAGTCEDGEHLGFISITASFLAKVVIEFLKSGKKMGFSVTPAGAVRT